MPRRIPMHGLGPILGPKLVHDAFDVHLDRVLRYSQLFANIAVAVAFGNSPQDLDLAVGERICADVNSQIFGHIGGKMLASGMYLADDSDQFVEWGALQHIAEGSRRERALNLVVALKGRHHDHPGVRKLIPNGYDGTDSAHIRKPEVHQRNIRPVLPELLKSLLSCACCPDQFQIVFIHDHRRNALAKKRMVIDTEDSYLEGLTACYPGNRASRSNASARGRRVLKGCDTRHKQVDFSSRPWGGSDFKPSPDPRGALT